MPVNYRNKLIFIHIPKTAGTSITQMLDMTTLEQMYFCGTITEYVNIHKPYSQKFNLIEYTNLLCRPPQHFTYREKEKIIGKDAIKDYFVFAVVRNPYSRLVSEFVKIRERHKIDSFNDFVDLNLYRITDYDRQFNYQGHLETQTYYLLDNDNTLNSINKIFKYENLEECYEMIKQIHPGIPFIHSNSASNPYDYRVFYTEDIRKKVYDFYKDDFVNFGYSATL